MQHIDDLTVLRMKDLTKRTGLSRSTLYDKLDPASKRHDPTFPRQVRLGPKAVGWYRGEVDGWIKSLSQQSA